MCDDTEFESCHAAKPTLQASSVRMTEVLVRASMKGMDLSRVRDAFEF